MRKGSRQGEIHAPADVDGDFRGHAHDQKDQTLGEHIATIWRLLRAMEVSPDHTPLACVKAFERIACNALVVPCENAAFGIPIERVVDPLLAAAFRSARRHWQALLPADEAGASSVRNQGELLLFGLLGSMDEPKRVILLLADMEQLSSPEIAALMGLRLDVVYEELRKARKAFVRARKRFENAGATGDAETEARELLALARTRFSPDSAAQRAVSQQLQPSGG
jgi:hypothetical protein